MLKDLKELFQRRFLYMKKLFILLVLILAFTNVTSCGGAKPPERDNEVKTEFEF